MGAWAGLLRMQRNIITAKIPAGYLKQLHQVVHQKVWNRQLLQWEDHILLFYV